MQNMVQYWYEETGAIKHTLEKTIKGWTALSLWHYTIRPPQKAAMLAVAFVAAISFYK